MLLVGGGEDMTSVVVIVDQQDASVVALSFAATASISC